MCGRFALYSSKQAIINYYKELVIEGKIKPDYNIAPSMIVPVIAKERGKYILRNVQWGYIPFWSKDKAIINIRAEGIDQKPSFKTAFQKHRCIIPANGFFEWRKQDKQPFFIKPKYEELFSLAGLYSISDNKITFGIITVQASRTLSKIHNRMPAIIKKEDIKTWLDGSDKNLLLEILKPYPDELIELYPVSKAVNNVRVNDKFIVSKIEKAKL